MNPTELIWAAIGFVLSLMVFSYLVGDNPFFRLTVSLFTGVAAGYTAVILIYQVIYPRLILPVLDGPLPVKDSILRVVIPVVLSILLFLLPSRKLSAPGRIPLAMLAGAAAAYAITGAINGTILPQTIATINLFEPGNAAATLPEALLVALGTLTTLMYFHFSARFKIGQPLKRAGWIEAAAWLGRLFLFITLGAVFAGVYTTAISALVERLNSFWEIITSLIL